MEEIPDMSSSMTSELLSGDELRTDDAGEDLVSSSVLTWVSLPALFSVTCAGEVDAGFELRSDGQCKDFW